MILKFPTVQLEIIEHDDERGFEMDFTIDETDAAEFVALSADDGVMNASFVAHQSNNFHSPEPSEY